MLFVRRLIDERRSPRILHNQVFRRKETIDGCLPNRGGGWYFVKYTTEYIKDGPHNSLHLVSRLQVSVVTSSFLKIPKSPAHWIRSNSWVAWVAVGTLEMRLCKIHQFHPFSVAEVPCACPRFDDVKVYEVPLYFV